MADVALSNDSIPLQSVIACDSLDFGLIALVTTTVKAPIRPQECLSIGVKLRVIVKVTCGNLIVGSNWENSLEYCRIRIQLMWMTYPSPLFRSSRSIEHWARKSG